MIGLVLYQNSKLKARRQELRRNSTDSERALWQLIRKSQVNHVKFIRQYSVGRYILDFYSPRFRLCIELDGGQHLRPENRIRDKQRTEFLNSLNIRVLRFFDNEVFQNEEGIIDRIIEMIGEISHPNLPLH